VSFDKQEVDLKKSSSLPSVINDVSSNETSDTDIEPSSENLEEDKKSQEDIHEYLEVKRVELEQKIGLEKLLSIYRLISESEHRDKDQVDYSDLAEALGPQNELFIDEIIQLVVADSIYGQL
jgi:hypothetical protein